MVEALAARRQPKALCTAKLVNQRKKAAPEGAAKFREETPRKGTRGTAERDAALQQYAETFAASQEEI
jgi:hypothetical protein